jgi:hypothetical protein
VKLGPFGDGANLDPRLVYGLRRNYHSIRNHFGRTTELLGDVGHVQSLFFPFRDSVSVDAR